MRRRRDVTWRLFGLASREFLFLSAFRQALRAGRHPAPDRVAAELEAILHRQAEEAEWDPWLAALYERAGYFLVVLADEVLLHSGWEAAPVWHMRLLEQKYFMTNVGGERFFELAAELQPEDTELAALVLSALALGFRGQYRDQPARLLTVRRKLQRRLAPYLAPSTDKLTPAAYRVDAATARPPTPFLTLRRVAAVVGGGLVAYYVLARVLWDALAGDVRHAAQALGAL